MTCESESYRLRMKILAAAVVALALAAPATASPKLTPAQRVAITRSIDVFVNHAVKRQNVGAAFDVTAPELRPGMTRKSWARSNGDLPVYPFPAQGTTHPWNILYVTREEVGLELQLQPQKGSKQGPIIFHIYLRPVGKRWLVDSFMPVAILAPLGSGKTKVRSVRDFSPQAAGGVSLDANGPHRLSSVWLVLPFALVGAALVGFACLGVARFFHHRRAYGARGEALPPLRRSGS
jgi:hypothetical protein